MTEGPLDGGGRSAEVCPGMVGAVGFRREAGKNAGVEMGGAVAEPGGGGSGPADFEREEISISKRSISDSITSHLLVPDILRFSQWIKKSQQSTKLN